MQVLQLLRTWTEPATMKLIIQETKPEESKGGKARRQPSETVLEGIRTIAGDEINCKRSEQKCFPELVQWGFKNNDADAKVAMEAIPLLSELYRNVFVDGYTFHSTRAIYAEMAWVAFAPPNMSKTAYFSQVLGHKEQSLTTALSYQKFAVRRKIQEDDPDLVSKITELQEDLNAFKKSVAKKPGFQDIPITSSVVVLYNLKKDPVELPKVPWTGKESRAEQLKETVDILKNKKILPSYNNLRKLGFGTNLIFRWRDKLDIADIEEMWKAQREEKKAKEDEELLKLRMEKKEKERIQKRKEKEEEKAKKRAQKLEERQKKIELKEKIKELERKAKEKEREWKMYMKELQKQKERKKGQIVQDNESASGQIVTE